MRCIKQCPKYYLTDAGEVLNQSGKEIKQKGGKVFICGAWWQVKLLKAPRKKNWRFSPEEKGFVLKWKGKQADGRFAFLLTFKRSISSTSWYTIRSKGDAMP